MEACAYAWVSPWNPLTVLFGPLQLTLSCKGLPRCAQYSIIHILSMLAELCTALLDMRYVHSKAQSLLSCAWLDKQNLHWVCECRYVAVGYVGHLGGRAPSRQVVRCVRYCNSANALHSSAHNVTQLW